MGEISFLYQVKNNPAYMQAFKYRYAKTTEYSFAYQRYVTLSDTSIINSPVAITKVAAGLSDLCGLFVNNRNSMMPDVLDGFNILKDGKSMEEIFQEHIDRDRYSIPEPSNDLISANVRFGMNIYDKGKMLNQYYYLSDNINKNAYHIMMKQLREKHGNILNTYFVENHYTAYLLENYVHGTTEEFTANTIPTVQGNGQDLIVNWQDILYSEQNDRIANTFPVVMSQKHDLTTNIMSDSLATRPIPISNFFKKRILERINASTLNAFKNILGKRPDIVGNHISIYMARRPDPHGNAYPIIVGEPQQKRIILPDTHMTTPTQRNVNANPIYLASMDSYNGNVQEVLLSRTRDKYIELNNTYNVFWRENTTSYFDLDNFTVTETKHGLTCNQYEVSNSIWDICMGYNNYFLLRDKYVGVYDNDIFANRECKGMIINVNVHGTTERRSLGTEEQGVHARIDRKKMNVKKGLGVTKSRRGVFLQRKTSWLLKDRLLTNDSAFGNVSAYKILNDMFLSAGFTFGTKDRNSVLFQDNIYNISKIKSSMVIDTFSTSIHKDSKNMVLSDSTEGIYRKEYDLPGLGTLDDVFGYKTSHSISEYPTISTIKELYSMWVEDNSVSAYHQKKDIAYFKVGLSVLKECLDTGGCVSDYDFAMKDWIPLDLVNSITNSYTGMIIPISKVRVQSFTDDINEMVSKLPGYSFITPNATGSVIPKDIFIPTMDLFCDKDGHSVFIDYYNYWAAKQAVRSRIYKDEFAFKGGHYISVLDQIWSQKQGKELSIFRQTQAVKSRVGVFINSDLFASKEKYAMGIYDDLFVDKENKVCYYYYDVTANKSKSIINLLQTLSADRGKYDMNRLCDLNAYLDSYVVNLYEPIVFPSAMLENLNILKTVPRSDRESYDMSIFLHDNGNWAWVYETPDPFGIDIFGIDELLLPENDTRYEDFANIIFDKETLTPRSPVKIINDTTFIAKYPIEHPISRYTDIGKIYEDSAEKWDNYFGVETDIMHDIFLKYYQIWQSRIFEFATMTMVQSTNKMLDLLYTWITMFYPVNKIEQALRIFRQIRWYSESAIIRNSQYIISYEYDTLRSNLHTGKCEIPNDLGENPTMYIADGVIRNNPDYIGQETYVTFTIDTHKNTLFRFSLSNQVGTVKVYVNDELVGMYPKSGIGYTINLPYTGETNYVKIVKEANHNLDSNFYIGYIEVPETSFKDLSIQFDPVLRAGNKPLDEVAKKLIAYANLHANRNEMYQVAKRNNAGITDTYNKMNEYWKNHHQNKTKGKRLTIRQL